MLKNYSNIIILLFVSYFGILIYLFPLVFSYEKKIVDCSESCVLEGTNDDDVLIADAIIPTIVEAKKGNDEIQGGAAPDALYGGDGDDRIRGDPTNLQDRGPNVMSGGRGDDVLLGGASSDYMYGNEGMDFLVPGSKGGTLEGGQGDDVIYGHSNATTIMVGGQGQDVFYCTNGIDIIMDYKSGAGENNFATGSTGDLLNENHGACELKNKDELKIDNPHENRIINN